jgi:putative ABC transport system ATP-binding protein
LDDCRNPITGRRFAYLGDETYLLPISLEDNLLYSLKHRPVRRPSMKARSSPFR